MIQPQPSGGFEWAQAPWGQVLRCRPLLAAADHFFTTGSIALRDDPREWEAVALLAGVPRTRLLLLNQVHGATVATAAPGAVDDWLAPHADGLVSNDPSAALVVRVADCAPILLADCHGRGTAAVHAGWRSTRAGIAAGAVRAMTQAFGTSPEDLIAAIGPSLGPCCGEMGDEVVQAFLEAGHSAARVERWFSRVAGRRAQFDLCLANREQLQEAGVRAEAIHVSGLCTRTHSTLFHSYRAHGQGTGRMAAVIRPRART